MIIWDNTITTGTNNVDQSADMRWYAEPAVVNNKPMPKAKRVVVCTCALDEELARS